MTSLSSDRGAVISEDGRYRYRLWRVVGPEARRCLFIMLNPSTADALLDDPTIRRCIGFARREGCGRLDVVNLYAFRSTAPSSLRSVDDPIGPDNDQHIRAALAEAELVVCAWGAHGQVVHGRRAAVVELIRKAGREPLCLGVTGDHSPSHPLYLRKTAPLLPWSPR